MKNLDELIKEYGEIFNQLEELNTKKDEIGKEIKELLKDKVGKEYTTESGIVAKLTDRITFIYDDTTALTNYLISKGLKNTYITESIDSKKLNAELKKSSTLYDGVKSYVTKTVTEVLKVGK